MVDRRDRIKVHIEGKEYSVVGGSFQDMLAAVKQINGRRFMSASKAWQLPGSYVDIQNQIEINGYQLEGGSPIADDVPPAQQATTRPGGDRIRVTVQGHQLAVVGGTFQDMLAAVKNLPGRRFDGDSKMWEIPGDVAIIKQLVETAGYQLEGAEKLDLGPVPAMETPLVTSAAEPPPFEAPDFIGDGDIPPYEPPDWWDDEEMPPPPMEAPDWWDDQPPELPPEPAPDFGSVQPSAPSSTPSSPASRGSDQIRVRIGGIPMVVSGGSFQQMLVAIKNIPGRRFDGNDKIWDIPAEVSLDGFRQQMEAAGFEVGRG